MHNVVLFDPVDRFQGNFLLSGSSDKSAIVWDVARGDVQQQFRFHEAPTLVSLSLILRAI